MNPTSTKTEIVVARVETPLLTSSEAKAYFRIKDEHTWARYQRLHKIPYERIGRCKMFHIDVLARIALKAQEATARKVYQ